MIDREKLIEDRKAVLEVLNQGRHMPLDVISAQIVMVLTDRGIRGPEVPEPTVQITDAMVERMARALFARTKEGRDGFTWPLNGNLDRQRDMDNARRALARVLGNAEQVENR